MSPEWKDLLERELKKDYMIWLKEFVDEERKTKNIFPHPTDTFNAFALCPFETLKVVILGQDPYHTPGTAHGLAFSTTETKAPPSLRYIIDEIWSDYCVVFQNKISREANDRVFRSCFEHNNLSEWAMQGVLLLNTILTVEQGKAKSHAKKGWEQFTVNAIDFLSKNSRYPVVFMLWGKDAQAYKKVISMEKHQHLILEAAHPAAEVYSPGAGFLGCKHFTKANDFIRNRKMQDWVKEEKKDHAEGYHQIQSLQINWTLHNKL